MAKANRVLSIELRVLDLDDDAHDALKELMKQFATDLHAAATLVTAGRSKPAVFCIGSSYRINISDELGKEGGTP
jgi:hypothetical protein